MDPRAEFEAFARRDGDRLLHAAYALCGDWQHAEDLVQQVLVRVAERWPHIDKPTAYAYRCLARANVDRWRSHRRHRREFLADPLTLVDEGAAADDPDATQRLAVVAALRALPPRQRAIVVLRYLHDLSEPDTAAALGISVGAVKSGASRALARLRTSQPSPFEEIR